MIQFIKNSLLSIRRFFSSPRVPVRDRLFVLLIIASIFSPMDFIPDAIPVVGLIDDLFLLTVLYDYCFYVLPRSLALELYAGSEKSFLRMKSLFKFLHWIRPAPMTRKIWRVNSNSSNQIQ